MPRVTRWFIRTGLVYLVIAMCLAVLQAMRGGGAWLGFALPVYVHFLTLGWLTQLILGVAFWMFPSAPKAGTVGERVAWISYGLLNVGLLLRGIAEPLAPQTGGAVGAALLLAAALQLAATLLAVGHLWPRVRGR